MPQTFTAAEDAVLRRIEDARDECVAFLQDFIRIPTTNPPGDNYRPCAEWLESKLRGFGYSTEFVVAEGRPEHTEKFPRVNVIGRLDGKQPRPVVHFNGHIDVVPAGHGWSVSPFDAIVRDGRIYGRGSTDQKAGIAASVFAIEAIRRAGIPLHGTIEQSGTVDEESGGFAGVAYLAETGRIAKGRTDYVIITEPLNVDRVCLGHRGVYWFKIATSGKVAHGSMPFLGVSAIDHLTEILHRIQHDLKPRLAARTTSMPVEPPGARHATLNVNSICGGQFGTSVQSPCVADRAEAILDRRFLLEEQFESVQGEIRELIESVRARHPDLQATIEDLMIVHPVLTDARARVVTDVSEAIVRVIGRRPELIASPGTYDQKHVSRIGMIDECIAYGPGILNLAHQPDEYCAIDDLMTATRVLALAAMRLSA